jgi:hypothetical protein
LSLFLQFERRTFYPAVRPLGVEKPESIDHILIEVPRVATQVVRAKKAQERAIIEVRAEKECVVYVGTIKASARQICLVEVCGLKPGTAE